MRKAGSLFILSITTLLTALALPKIISAATSSVHVSTSTSGGGESSVQVHNSVNSSSSTTTTNNSSTHVRIESNGQVKEYDSNGNEDVHVQSDDGNSTVNITHGNDTKTSNTSSPTITPWPTKKDEDVDASKSAKHTPQAHVNAKIETHMFPFDLGAFLRQLFSHIFGK